MSWTDWDYLTSGLEALQKVVRDKLFEIEKNNGYEECSDVILIYNFHEKIIDLTHEDISFESKAEKVKLISKELLEMPDSIFKYNERMQHSLQIDCALSQERRNLDQSEPFSP